MTNVYFDYEKGIKDVKEKMCVCGHKLFMHAFVDAYNDFTDTHYLRVSICTSCSCKEFKQDSNK